MRHCVNPAHLYEATPTGNAKDAVAAGAKRGRVLTASDAAEIRRRNILGVSQRELSRVYKVSQPHISRVINDQSWAGAGTAGRWVKVA